MNQFLPENIFCLYLKIRQITIFSLALTRAFWNSLQICTQPSATQMSNPKMISSLAIFILMIYGLPHWDEYWRIPTALWTLLGIRSYSDCNRLIFQKQIDKHVCHLLSASLNASSRNFSGPFSNVLCRSSRFRFFTLN